MTICNLSSWHPPVFPLYETKSTLHSVNTTLLVNKILFVFNTHYMCWSLAQAITG